MWFLKCITCVCPEADRLEVAAAYVPRQAPLLELFPNARFVHIIRDPHVHLSLRPSSSGSASIATRVANSRHRGKVWRSTSSTPSTACTRSSSATGGSSRLSRLCEVRYEELVVNPIGQMRAVYQQLELGDFDRVLPALKKYFADKANYQTNRFQLSPRQRRNRPPLAPFLEPTATPSGRRLPPPPPLPPPLRLPPRSPPPRRRHGAERPPAPPATWA